MSGASWTCRIIRSWSHNSFEMFKSIRNDSKARTLGAVWVEADIEWYFVTGEKLLQLQKKERFVCIVIWLVMKSRYTMKTLSVEDREVSQPCINIDGKAKYPWFKASALHLVGSGGCSLLWAAQTGRKPSQEITIDDNWCLCWALKERTATIQADTTDFAR